MRAVLHRDRVKARVVRFDNRGRPEGRVVEILERPDQPIIGRLLQEGGVWLVAPEDKRYGQDVLIPKGATGQAKTGQVVVVELAEPPSLFGQPVGRIKEVLGEMDDPGMEIEIAVRKYGVPHEFSPACLAMARALPDQVRPQDATRRVDLTMYRWSLSTVRTHAISMMRSIANPPKWVAARAGVCWWPLPM